MGNSTTRDNVIRREMRLVEGAVFNTEALKYSIRRLNQLGYFEQINEQDQQAIKTEKTAGRENQMDVTLTLKEQNRNQLTFGAGVSQYEGIFGQLAFQTANFLGRGESLTVSLMAGDRMQNYQLAFTEPFLFDRNITAGFDVYKRALQYIGYYTQKSTGGNLMMGFPVADFSRVFVSYAYEGDQDHRPQRGVHRSDLRSSQSRDARPSRSTDLSQVSPGGAREPAPQSVHLRFAPGRRRRTSHGQQDRPAVSFTTPSTTRSSRTPVSG